MLSKNTCEGVHLIVKLLAISLQACKFTKMNFFTHVFEGFWLDFKLFFVLFLEIISWKGGCFMSQSRGVWGGGHCFSDRGISFLCGGGRGRVPHRGASVLMGERVFEKNCWTRGGGPSPPCTSTVENPGGLHAQKK